MSIALNKAPGKPFMPFCLRPTIQEGLYIRYRLRSSGKTFASIAREFNLHKSTPDKIVYGKRHSRRIEAEIARILGKENWNEVVLEARSEVQKKPVEVIIQEIQAEVNMTPEEIFACKDWEPYLKQMRKEAAEARAERKRAKRMAV